MEHIKQFLGTVTDKVYSFLLTVVVTIKFILISLGGLAILGFFLGGGAMALMFVFALMYLYSAFVSAFVGSHLWLWFVVPIFGVSALTFPQAFGLALLLNYWTHQHFSQHTRDERTWKQKMPETIGLLSRPWWILLTAWVCHHFFM